MNWEIQILLVLLSGVFASFNQIPLNQFRLTFNSTLPTENKQLFKPIIIPNITGHFEHPETSNSAETTKGEDIVQQPALRPYDLFKKLALTENDSSERFPGNGNSVKFSSRYSTEKKELLKNKRRAEQEGENTDRNQIKITEESDSLKRDYDSKPENDGLPENEKRKLFSVRSDDLNSSEEEKEDVQNYFDTNEPEESEVAPTTNGPYKDLPGPTSFQNGPHSEVFENYETTSTLAEEKDNSEKEETEEKRSANDYYDSSSKNYHSVQTPLGQIRYRGPHSSQKNVTPLKIRTRLLSPAKRLPDGHNWPYSGSKIKPEPERENEISIVDESSLEEGIKEELKGKPNVGLELAAEKDETKFGKNKNYNYLEERNNGKEKLKSLAAEEERDHRLSFGTLKQYEVDEEPRNQYLKKPPQKLKFAEGAWSNVPPVTTTARNIFKDTPDQTERPTGLDISNELISNFKIDQILGPVVFNDSLNQKKTKPASKSYVKISRKEPVKDLFAKDLLNREKLDRDNLINQRIQNIILENGNFDSQSQSFNHLEESEELYNAILANIQSVFGLKTQPFKSRAGGSRRLEVDLDESRSLARSSPLNRSSKVE